MALSTTAKKRGVRTRVLFVGEAVTLAHVARPAALAAGLDPKNYELHFAASGIYRSLLGTLQMTEHEVASVAPDKFAAALAAGRPLYDFATLKSYVEAERELLAAIKPDVVVGDFRITLPVSAALAGIPSVTLSNACWSPYVRQRYTVPDLPMTRMLGAWLAQGLFSVGRPVAFALHSRPMAALRRHYGLPGLGLNLGRVYTDGDYTLYADIPGLYEMRRLPDHHRFIGPVLWSPRIRPPDWWGEVPDDRPIVYVTPGSSGRPDLLPRMISALEQLPVTALVATAGQKLPERAGADPRGGIYVSDYLPGDLAAQRSRLVICNGGSPTTHQALAAGRPVLGIPNNLDQFMNMQTIERAGAGRTMRGESFSEAKFGETVQSLLQDEGTAAAALELSRRSESCNAVAAFREFMDDGERSWQTA